jgi:hypothetical protein
MRRNSVVTLRAAREAWPPVQAPPRADANAVYGCVDWYLYHDPALAAGSAAAELGSAQDAGRHGSGESLVAA